MLKIGLIAGAIAATGGTAAYVVHASRQDGTVEKVAAAPAAAATRAADRPAVAPPQARRASRPDAPALPARVGSPMVDVDDPPQEDLDRATIDRLKLHDGPSRGPARAPVTIVVYTDFLCTFCGKVLGTIDDLWDEYPGKLRLVVKQYPVHQEARLAAEAALAADEQGKFWEMHDLMMASQEEKDLSRDALVAHAKQAGLDVASFSRALDQRTYRAAVEADMAAGQEIEVRGTPAFFINGKRFTGARPIEQFRAGIDAALAEVGRN